MHLKIFHHIYLLFSLSPDDSFLIATANPHNLLVSEEIIKIESALLHFFMYFLCTLQLMELGEVSKSALVSSISCSFLFLLI